MIPPSPSNVKRKNAIAARINGNKYNKYKFFDFSTELNPIFFERYKSNPISRLKFIPSK